jgi:putative hydrolase of the HAD superfamily
MPPIKYLLFDLDNTLYSYTSGLLSQLREQIRRWLADALAIAPDDAAALSARYSKDYGSTLGGIRHHHPELDPEAYLAAIHVVPVENTLTPDPALAAMCARLPYPKVIFTNSIREWSERVLGCLGIREHFEHIIDIRASDYRGKPQPLAYERVTEILNVPASACVLLDDSPKNVHGAIAFGMRAILIGEHENKADGIRHTARDILAAEAVLRHWMQGENSTEALPQTDTKPQEADARG